MKFIKTRAILGLLSLSTISPIAIKPTVAQTTFDPTGQWSCQQHQQQQNTIAWGQFLLSVNSNRQYTGQGTFSTKLSDGRIIPSQDYVQGSWSIEGNSIYFQGQSTTKVNDAIAQSPPFVHQYEVIDSNTISLNQTSTPSESVNTMCQRT
jgi:hypothetical protein